MERDGDEMIRGPRLVRTGKDLSCFLFPILFVSNSSVREWGEIIVVDQTDTEKQIPLS
jgi:hypothetical protein